MDKTKLKSNVGCSLQSLQTFMQQQDDEVEKKATSSWWDKREQENIGG
jgi:hypothetical protein